MYIAANALKGVSASTAAEDPSAGKDSSFVPIIRTLVYKAKGCRVFSLTLLPNSMKLDPAEEKALQDFLNSLPNSLNVSRPGQPQYEEDIYHWAITSTYKGVCTFRPDTADDISFFFKTLDKVPKPLNFFGVKSGGHTGNPGFSSSPGGLINMKNFNQVEYDAKTKTAVIGAGQIWDHVYEELAKHNVCVLGARVTHIGVAGFLLGGGYSWQTNQYGLAMDNVVAFELVKPDGTIVNVTEASDPDLFFAMKGGGNNFGIVTKFTMKTFPLGQVWGGPILIMEDPDEPERAEQIKKLFTAVQTFIDKVTDPKAAILVSLGTLPGPEDGPEMLKLINFLAFYDGPSPPAGIFDVFKEIAPSETSYNWKTRDYPDFVKNAMVYDASKGYRGSFDTVALARYTPNLLQAIWNENEYWGKELSYKKTSRFLITYSVEPFLPTILTHGPPTAYPPDRKTAFSPFPIYMSWDPEKPEKDAELLKAMKMMSKRLQEAAEKEGIEVGPKYPNYAISGTPLEEMYGQNIERLKKTKARIDPKNIMGHAGGFKFEGSSYARIVSWALYR